MTIKQLRKALKKFPKDLIVRMPTVDPYDGRTYLTPVTTLWRDTHFGDVQIVGRDRAPIKAALPPWQAPEA